MGAANVPAEVRRPRARRFSEQIPYHRRARTIVRKTLSLIRSTFTPLPSEREWVHFPMYHHVLDDERRGFDRQLRYMRRHGEFLSADDAIDALAKPGGIGGRYFCVTFDDGFKNSHANALPILVENRCPAIFFIATDYIGLDLDDDWDRIRAFPQPPMPYPLPFEYMTWDECRTLQDAGMSFGSHTCSHLRPIAATADAFERELVQSKALIEAELGRTCLHFACPFGRPGVDFDPATHPAQVRRAGFRSFFTTAVGPNTSHADPFAIRRLGFLAHHWNCQVLQQICTE